MATPPFAVPACPASPRCTHTVDNCLALLHQEWEVKDIAQGPDCYRLSGSSSSSSSSETLTHGMSSAANGRVSDAHKTNRAGVEQ
jgi:hypothetical protein